MTNNDVDSIGHPLLADYLCSNRPPNNNARRYMTLAQHEAY